MPATEQNWTLLASRPITDLPEHHKIVQIPCQKCEGPEVAAMTILNGQEYLVIGCPKCNEWLMYEPIGL